MAATLREYETMGALAPTPAQRQLQVMQDGDVVAAFLAGEERVRRSGR